ncbi:lipopolysaccharide biosynthesis protein [Streptomyces sp. NPDC059680]|uniref:lipopolysaccharide biosynthesis protein n=1 Tax=Streptomyces sp. NPDC059680 TaxID=3346904 RepID=UPI0036AA05A7
MATSLINALLGYGYWTLAARFMPSTAVGIGSAATSALVLVSLTAHLGAGAGLIARLPQRTSDEEWQLTAVTALVTTAAVALLVAVAATFSLALAVHSVRVLSSDPLFAAFSVLGVTGWTMAGILDHLFIAERRSALMMARNASTALSKLIGLGAVVLVRTDTGPLALVGTWAVSALVGSATGILLCHRRIRRLRPVPLAAIPSEMASLMPPALGHHAISLGGLAPTYLLPIVVTARLGARANARFYIAWMVCSAVFMISPAVASTLFAQGSHDAAHLRRLTRRTSLVTLGAITVAAMGICATAPIVLRLFGTGYSSGFTLLLILLLSAFPDAVSNLAVAVFRVRRQFLAAAAVNALIAVVTVAGAWLTTPALGVCGAGLAWLGAQTAGVLVALVLRGGLRPTEGVSYARS